MNKDIALLQEELKCLRQKTSTMLSTAGGYTDQITSPGSSVYPDDYRENCGCVDLIAHESDPMNFCQTSGGDGVGSYEGQTGLGDIVNDVYEPGNFQGVFYFDNLNGVLYKAPDSTTWENRNVGLADVTLEHGCKDEWWYRKNTPAEENVILYRVGIGKVLVSKNAGTAGWQNVTPTPPTGYTLGQITFSQIISDPFTQNAFYVLASDGNRTWVVKTTNNFQSASWLDVTTYNDVVSRVPIWMSLEGNGGELLWVTTLADGQLTAMKLNNDSPMTISSEYALGSATLWDVQNYWETFSPVGPIDSNSMYFYGRGSDPQGLGLSHVIKTDDEGLNWEAVEQSWGDDWCGSLKFGLEGIMYSVRNTR